MTTNYIMNDKVSKEGSKNYSRNEHNMRPTNNRYTIINGIRKPNPNWQRGMCQHCGTRFSFLFSCTCGKKEDGS